MIKSWMKFNESSDDALNLPISELRKQLSDKLTEVREVFMSFEDMGIISYSIIASGYERGGYVQFDPKVGDFERFLDMITPTVRLGLTPDSSLGGPGLTSKYNKLGRKYNTSDKYICIITDIKIPGEQNEFGSTVIGNEGIKLFEDILVANSRLIDSGYDVKLDLNSSHGQYKPAKFLIYFDLL